MFIARIGLAQLPVWSQELMPLSHLVGIRLGSWQAGGSRSIQFQQVFHDRWRALGGHLAIGSYSESHAALAKVISISEDVFVSGALGVNWRRWNGAGGMSRTRPWAALQLHLIHSDESEAEGRIAMCPMGLQPNWQTRNELFAQICWERVHLNRSYRADVWWQAGGFAMRGGIRWAVNDDFFCGLSARAIAGFLGVTIGGKTAEIEWALSIETGWEQAGTSLTLDLTRRP